MKEKGVVGIGREGGDCGKERLRGLGGVEVC